jgi:methylated-DNA-[protein]-cysteine S-methyltransferase
MSTAPLRRCVWQSPLGPLSIWAWGENLVRLGFPGHNDLIEEGWAERHFATQPIPVSADEALFREVIAQLEDYFAAKRQVFELPIAFYGTAFQKQVWQAVSSVAWGQTTTYGRIAEQIGKPLAVRAVGAANGANPLSIIVPCHRIVGSDGKLHGYGGGIERKERLLALERAA